MDNEGIYAEAIANGSTYKEARRVCEIVEREVAAEREKLAGLMDAEADEQEAAWRAHLESGENASATSFHSVTRSWANRIREA